MEVEVGMKGINGNGLKKKNGPDWYGSVGWSAVS